MLPPEKIIEINEGPQGNIYVFRISGKINTISCVELEKKINTQIQQKQKNILLNLENVSYISSAGLRLLLQIHKQLTVLSGKLVICGISTGVSEVITMCGLNHVLIFADDERDAQEKF